MKYKRNELRAEKDYVLIGGGCFWGVEAYIAKLNGISYTEVGYANGTCPNPSYELICDTETNFVEVVYIEFDNNIISIQQILAHVFKVIDPTTINQQGNDVGTQYRTGIYTNCLENQLKAKDFLKNIEANYQNPIVTEVKNVDCYYKAEDYHQKYLDKNPNGYCHIKL